MDAYLLPLAQQEFLKKGELYLLELAQLYGAVTFSWEPADSVVSRFKQWPLRVAFDELPQASGTGDTWKADLDSGLKAFFDRTKWLLGDMQAAVAVLAVVKPPPDSRRRGLNDLDNVMRTYIAPRVISVFAPVSDPTFFIAENFQHMAWPRPPANTKIGINRYEVWRLPPAGEAERGFVSVALVNNMYGQDTFSAVDAFIAKASRS